MVWKLLESALFYQLGKVVGSEDGGTGWGVLWNQRPVRLENPPLQFLLHPSLSVGIEPPLPLRVWLVASSLARGGAVGIGRQDAKAGLGGQNPGVWEVCIVTAHLGDREQGSRRTASWQQAQGPRERALLPARIGLLGVPGQIQEPGRKATCATLGGLLSYNQTPPKKLYRTLLNKTRRKDLMDIQVVSVSSSSRQGTSCLFPGFHTSLQPSHMDQGGLHVTYRGRLALWSRCHGVSMWPALGSLWVFLRVARFPGLEQEPRTPQVSRVTGTGQRRAPGFHFLGVSFLEGRLLQDLLRSCLGPRLSRERPPPSVARWQRLRSAEVLQRPPTWGQVTYGLHADVEHGGFTEQMGYEVPATSLRMDIPTLQRSQRQSSRIPTGDSPEGTKPHPPGISIGSEA